MKLKETLNKTGYTKALETEDTRSRKQNRKLRRIFNSSNRI